jgi:hypothetical protein
MKPGSLVRFRVSHDGPKHLGILVELIDTQLVSGRMCYAKVFVPHNGDTRYLPPNFIEEINGET